MRITELDNGRLFVEATDGRVLTNAPGVYFDTTITHKDVIDLIKEVDRPSEYWGMDLSELFPDELFDKQRDEIQRILNTLHDTIQRVEKVMDELTEMRTRTK